MPTSKTGAHRESGTDELDYYPTPPWATRALIHEVILRYPQHFPIPTNALSLQPNRLPLLLEPCCGEGHMWEALHEQWADDFEFHAGDIQDLGFARQDSFYRLSAAPRVARYRQLGDHQPAFQSYARVFNALSAQDPGISRL